MHAPCQGVCRSSKPRGAPRQWARWEAAADAFEALFNELYFLVEGGALWTDGVPWQTVAATQSLPWWNQLPPQEAPGCERRLGCQSREKAGREQPTWADCEALARSHYAQRAVDANGGDGSPLGEEARVLAEMGHFVYLEGLEYLMYNTYDVHFYASWALLSLFPKLDAKLQLDVAHAVLAEDAEVRPCLAHGGDTNVRKREGAVPHDLGGPGEAPVMRPNVYNLHHTGDWKDLPSKFVLQVCKQR
jgi:non-lysosomal glucosylceramidase